METPPDSGHDLPEEPSQHAYGEVVDRTCGTCNAIFRLDFVVHEGRNETQKYRCPGCGTPYTMEAAAPPGVQLLSGHRDEDLS